MLTENYFNNPWLILVVVFAVIKEAGAQCATNGCTICSDMEIVCEGLNSVPPLDYTDEWSNIEQISLTNGFITSIPAGYFNLSNLEIINLTYNELTTFNITSLAYATQLRTINLTGNPIVCDGNIDWLQKWKTFYPPGNRVYGTCANSKEDINTYLSNKPGGLVNVKLSNSSFVFYRRCKEIFLPFIVVGDFASPLEYRAFIHGQTNQATFNVVTEDITITVGENNFNITIAITSRGEDTEEVDALLQIISKYPVSYETNAEIRLKYGAYSCTAAAPIKTVATQTPSSSQDASETLSKIPRVSFSPTFVSVAATLTDIRETTSSAGITQSLDHTQSPGIIQSQGPTLNHQPTAIPVPTTQGHTSTKGRTTTVKNGPAETVPAMTVTTQKQSASQGTSETVKQKPEHGTSPPIPSMPMSPTDTAEPTQGPLYSTTPKQVTFAENTLISKKLPTPEPTSPQSPRKLSVPAVAPETTPTGNSGRTENKGCECVNDTANGSPKVALVVIATAVVTAVVTVIIIAVFIIAIWYYWSKRRSREKVDSTTPIKNDVSLDDSSTAL